MIQKPQSQKLQIDPTTRNQKGRNTEKVDVQTTLKVKCFLGKGIEYKSKSSWSTIISTFKSLKLIFVITARDCIDLFRKLFSANKCHKFSLTIYYHLILFVLDVAIKSDVSNAF